jgi:hypothetical protein
MDTPPQLIRTLSIRPDRTLTKVLQHVVPHQEVMTHIDVSDDNSTAEQNMARG